MAVSIPIAVLLSLLVTGTMAGDYGTQTTPSTSTPASYTPTPTTPPPPPPPTSSQPATPSKPAHGYRDDDNNNTKLVAVVRVVVEGQVLCQSCAKRGLDGAAPLPKAQVMVTCRDRNDRIMAQRLCVADPKGNFHVEFSVERADPRGACFVRLLSSPDPKCNMVSDIHLHDEGKHWIDDRGVRNVVYAARKLAFRARKCAPMQHH